MPPRRARSSHARRWWVPVLRSRWTAFLLGTSLPVALSLPALANGPALGAMGGVVVEWNAPEGCPQVDAVIASIRRTFRGEPLNVNRIHASVHERAPGNWALDLELVDASGTTKRSLAGDSCAAVTDGGVVVVAMAISVEPARNEEDPRPAASQPDHRLVKRDSIDSSNNRVESSTYESAVLGVAIVGDHGTLPASAPGVAILFAGPGGGALGQQFRVEVEGGYYARVRGATEARPDEGATFSLISGGIRACYALVEGASSGLSAGFCGGGGAARVHADGYGSQTTGEASAIVPFASAGGLARWKLRSQIALRLALEVAAPFQRPLFMIDGTGLVHRGDALTLRGALGVEFEF